MKHIDAVLRLCEICFESKHPIKRQAVFTHSFLGQKDDLSVFEEAAEILRKKYPDDKITVVDDGVSTYISRGKPATLVAIKNVSIVKATAEKRIGFIKESIKAALK